MDVIRWQNKLEMEGEMERANLKYMSEIGAIRGQEIKFEQQTHRNTTAIARTLGIVH